LFGDPGDPRGGNDSLMMNHSSMYTSLNDDYIDGENHNHQPRFFIANNKMSRLIMILVKTYIVCFLKTLIIIAAMMIYVFDNININDVDDDNIEDVIIININDVNVGESLNSLIQ